MLRFLGGIAFLVLGYFLYGKLAEKVFAPDDRETPAVKLADGTDYVILPRWKNMLIQLLNIAGIGPVIGVILGIKFGIIALVIIPIGCVLMGAVHDMAAGMMSIRDKGANLPKIVHKNLGMGYNVFFEWFMVVLLLLVVAVFINVPANLINTTAQEFSTPTDPVAASAYEPENYFWVAVVAIFCYYVIATMFPVDKIIGKVYPFFGLMLLVGTLAIFFALLVAGFKEPSIMQESKAFQLHKFNPDTAPVFPLLFVTIACGIISGFHATQSPIIARTMKSEREAKSDFYGMMIVEGIIAMIWAVGGLAIYNLKPEFMSKSGPVVLCEITTHFLGSWMGTITVLAVVILAVTSGDAALRSTRLSLAEMLHIPQQNFLPRFLTCLPLIVLVAGLLYWSNTDAKSFNKLWNYFAWGNQVLAATTLMAATVWLLRRGKKIGSLITLIPGMFMTAVVVTFIVWTSRKLGQPDGIFFFTRNGGLPYGTSVAIGVIAAVGFAVFVLRQGKKPDPLIDYTPSAERYTDMEFRHCGNTGLQLPRVSLGLWHNFGAKDNFDAAHSMVWTAFDHGITHFDLANNYGPPAGSAEEAFGHILKADFTGKLRDELIVSTKAGYTMWPGPYGDKGSRKYLIASCDQSLKRLGLDYVDVFYHHRMDPDTPVEESMLALDQIVRSGRALYVGISNYSPERAREAFSILRELKTPTVLHQVRYNMFNRDCEKDGTFDVMKEFGVGGIIFSPMAQGLLTNRYLDGIPEDSRMTRQVFLKPDALTPETKEKIRKLNELAQKRGQSLASMTTAWVLRHDVVASALVGASRPSQIVDVLNGLDKNSTFTAEELAEIDAILK
ncbi:MAG: aldo/keto reductase [Lentisphaeria bacterium]|nr:aldo/keto reductase [Lentisphaeria bacterium]